MFRNFMIKFPWIRKIVTFALVILVIGVLLFFIDDLMRDLEEKTGMIDKLQVDIIDSISISDEYRVMVVDLQKRASNLVSANKDLDDTIFQQKRVISDMQSEIDKLTIDYVDSKSEFDNLVIVNERQKIHSEDQARVIQELNSTLDRLRNTVNMQEERRTLLEQTLTDLRTAIEGYKLEISTHERTISDKLIIIEEQNSKILEMENHLSSLKLELSATEISLQDMSVELDSIVRAEKGLREEIIIIQRNLIDVSAELSILKDIVLIKNSELALLQTENIGLTEDIKLKDSIISQLEEDILQIDILEKEILQLNDSLQQQLSIVDNKEIEVKSLGEQIIVLTKSLNDSDDVVSQLKEENTQLVSNLQEKISKLENSLQISDNQRLEIADLNKQLDDDSDMISEQKILIDRLLNETTLLKNEIATLKFRRRAIIVGVSSSSNWSAGYTAGFAFDGNEDTRWSSSTVRMDLDGQKVHLISSVLRHSRRIERLRLKAFFDPRGAQIRNFRFEVFGVNKWITILETKADNVSGWQEWNFDNTISSRFYRVVIIDNHTPELQSSVWEIELLYR